MTVLFRALPLIPKPPTYPSFPVFLKPFFANPLLPQNTTLLSLSASSSSSSSSSYAAASSPSPPPTPSSSTETLFPISKFSRPHKKTALNWVNRTALCGQLTVGDVGKRVRLCGWVALHRVHGGLTFLNLRDHTGTVQVTTIPDEFPDAHCTINDLRLEYVIAVEGVVRSRPSESVNKKMKTGFIEIAAEQVHVLNSVKSKLPFLVTTADDAVGKYPDVS